MSTEDQDTAGAIGLSIKLSRVGAMARNGLAKLEEKRIAEEKAAEEREAMYQQEWSALQKEVRLAFDDRIRDFVFVDGACGGPPIEGPGDKHQTQAWIDIPNYAPILVRASPRNGEWMQDAHPKGRGQGYFYLIPAVKNDIEFGLNWNWSAYAEVTNDLEEALAMAERSGLERMEMEAQQVIDKSRMNQEPVYEAMDADSGLVVELSKMVREMVNAALESKELRGTDY